MFGGGSFFVVGKVDETVGSFYNKINVCKMDLEKETVGCSISI